MRGLGALCRKRLVVEFDDGLFALLHLMIAGRLRWQKPGAALARGRGLAAFDFDRGSLVFTEASSKKRASLHLVRGRAALAAFDRGGLEVLQAAPAEFDAALRRENHTLKRALTDPRILSGIGNAYSDEILHRARLSPFKQTAALAPDEMARTVATASRARSAARRYSGSSTPRTRPTTAPAARPAAGCWPTGPCRGCSRATGREPSTNWSPARAAPPADPLPLPTSGGVPWRL